MQDASAAGNFDAAFRDAVAHHKAGRIAEAIAAYEALVPAAPPQAQLYYLLGSAYGAVNQHDDAIATLQRAVTIDNRHIPTLEMLGSLFVKTGRAEQAIVHFQNAARMSGTPDALLRLANTLLRCGRHEEAKPVYEQLAARAPGEIQAYIGLALCLAGLGATQAAENTLRDCIARFPTDAKARVALGTLLAQPEKIGEAEAIFRSVLAFEPENAEANAGVADCLHKQARFDEATAFYRNALAARPHDTTILCHLGETLIELHRLDEAEDTLRQAQALDAANAAVLTSLGRIQELRGDLTAAIALHDRALGIAPRHFDALTNRGSAKRFAGDVHGAIADYDAALAVRPGFPPALANKALSLLTLGRFDEAWPHYRNRLRARPGALNLTGDAPWNGKSLAGKDVLLWTEYGIGDEILFASLLPELADATASCTVVCAPRLCTLFQRSFPAIQFLPLGAPLPRTYDVHMPLTDAAQFLRPDWASFPRHDGYLAADPALTSALRSRYQAGGARPLIGISWRSASGASGRFKSTALSDWSGIVQARDATYVSLQYGNVQEEIAAAANALGRPVINDPSIDSVQDIDAFAAQVAAMDLVISVSNTTVHVAGALGKPVWILAPRGPGMHWYWHLDRADNPWYPSARIFRQREPMAWDTPLADVARDLAAWPGP